MLVFAASLMRVQQLVRGTGNHCDIIGDGGQDDLGKVKHNTEFCDHNCPRCPLRTAGAEHVIPTTGATVS